ncbi:ladderlectin-like [Oreochromis aureus]|uniref:ladderlectin-like n=1 Tax=Oreochromis aureus TaxID=47969 RepID=UPI00195424C5|nr:ladderlectin-like [Oreochromis aureus]
MKLLTVSALLCAMIALTTAANEVGKDGSESNPQGEHLVEKRSTCFRDFWGWTKYGNQYFQFFPNQLTWAQAQRHCQALNANLASVRNLGEYQAIQRVILNGARNNVPTWIGGSDAQEEGYWFWIDGTRFTYANWCQGEPNNVGAERTACI